jgi:hypothetical protein
MLLLLIGSVSVYYFFLVICFTAGGRDGSKNAGRLPVVPLRSIAFQQEQQSFDGQQRVLLLQQHDSSSSSSKLAPSPSSQHTTPRFCAETSRCQTLRLDNPLRNFSFVHISKASGASWVRELKAVINKFNNSSTSTRSHLFPQAEQGAEFGVAYQNAHAFGSDGAFDFVNYHLISLRSPRHHSWSLFLQCKYGEWGVQTTRGTNFPRSGTTIESDLTDYRIWLYHFLRTHDNSNANNNWSEMTRKKALLVPIQTHCYRCYQAANYQTSVLTSRANKPRRQYDLHPRLEPDLQLAQLVYESMDWVALTEFFHESKCLFYFRLAPKSAHVLDYIENTCHCNSSSSSSSSSTTEGDVHITHHAQAGRDSKMLDWPLDVLAAVDALTRVDQELYIYALQQFMREMAWLETQLGRRVLCDPVLDTWEPELAYLLKNISVTTLYQNEKRQHMRQKDAIESTTTTEAKMKLG